MKVGATTLATVTTWSFTSSQETLDVTTLGDRDRKIVGGTRSITGSASISWYSDSTNSSAETGAATLLGNLIKPKGFGTAEADPSDQVELTLGIKDHADAEKSMKITVVLTSIAMTSSQGEVFSAEVSFEATGAPTTFTLDNP